MINVVDYSQYSTWMFCPWRWWYNYVEEIGKSWTGQRRDPLALGGLVHDGLDVWKKTNRPEISDRAIGEYTPTPETMQLANLLVHGYIQKYPSEPWPVEATEQPLTFGLSFSNQSSIGPRGLAKLDGFFQVDNDTTIDMGLPGETIRLKRGIWGREYKTKSWSTDRATWIQEWQSKMQADFQMLALREQVGESPQGILVCVLEKPREYIPKRKCTGCKESYEMGLFFTTGEGGVYACPGCSMKQKLSPYEPKSPKVPEFYRITATRTAEQLDTARREIGKVAVSMIDMINNGKLSVVPNRDNCINNRYHSRCVYAEPDIAGREPDGSFGFIRIDSKGYMGLKEEV
jgi:CRISPR/Cas system-associated exonuclease Cas4 (RecB family)